jgi:hypothetical protein
MHLNETYSTVHISKNLSEKFPTQNGLKEEDALSPLLYNFALEYAIRRVQENQQVLKFSETHSLAYTDDVNTVGENVDIRKENTESILVASKEVGLEVNSEKPKYMLMSRSQKLAQKHSIRVENGSFKTVAIKYLETR